MSIESSEVLERALRLSPGERATIAEELLSSLHSPLPEREALWLQEARDRLMAYDAGEMPTISEEEVFAEWDEG